MRITRKLALTLSAAVAVLGLVPTPVAAGGVSCGDTISTDTTLTGNLDCSAYGGTALWIGADNIVLNLGGYTVTGWTGDDSYTGIYNSEYVGVTVRHGKIRNFNDGIYAGYTNTMRIKGVTIKGESGDARYGVYFYYVSRSTVSDSEFNMANATAIYSEYGVKNTFSDNHIVNGYYGIETYEEYKDSILYNVVEGVAGQTYGFYDDYSGNNVYVGNTSNGGYDGFYLDCDEYGWAVLVGNFANDNTNVGIYTYYCFEYDALGEPGSYIANNTANSNGSQGFYEEYSYNTLWENNIAKHNGSDGFYVYGSKGSIFRNNLANRNDGSGFYFDPYSTYTTKMVKNNTANRNGASGLYASAAIESKNNSAANNDDWDCFNVNC